MAGGDAEQLVDPDTEQTSGTCCVRGPDNRSPDNRGQVSLEVTRKREKENSAAGRGEHRGQVSRGRGDGRFCHGAYVPVSHRQLHPVTVSYTLQVLK